MKLKIVLKNPSSTLQKSADFNLQVCFISVNELQCGSLNLLQRYQKCVHSIREYF
jgi:hypothetical protein